MKNFKTILSQPSSRWLPLAPSPTPPAQKIYAPALIVLMAVAAAAVSVHVPAVSLANIVEKLSSPIKMIPTHPLTL